MGKKEILANLLFRSGSLRSFARLHRKGIVVLAYHRIRPEHGDGEYLLQDSVLGPTQIEFEQQVKWLKENFDVLSESDLLQVIREPIYKGRSVVITFDDGYSDNYNLAYPVLQAYSAPAIFFICPHLIESRSLGWWDVIPYLVKKTTKTSITVLGETLALGSQKQATLSLLNAWVIRRPHAETKGLLQELAESCGVSFPDRGFQDAHLMTWPQVLEVSRSWVTVGSHTHTHRVLATLDEQDQRWELQESKRALEAKLNRKVRTIAYPVGGYRFTATTMRLARECGYEGAFSFRTGFNIPQNYNPYNIRRIPPRDQLDAMFACSTYVPRVFTWSEKLPESHRVAVSQWRVADGRVRPSTF